MPINGSELVSDPWGTIFSPFTDLLGTGFWLIPLTFIAVALYIKSRDVVVTSLFLLGSSLILSGGNIFAGYPEMAFVYLIFSALGIVGVVLGVFFMRK